MSERSSNGTVHMLGEWMKVLVRADCVTEITPNQAIRLPKITEALCETLHRRHVARQLLLKVRIGDTVALVDKNTGYTYRLLMDCDEIQVLGIYDNHLRPDNPAEQVLILVNTRVLELVAGAGSKAVAA